VSGDSEGREHAFGRVLRFGRLPGYPVFWSSRDARSDSLPLAVKLRLHHARSAGADLGASISAKLDGGRVDHAPLPAEGELPAVEPHRSVPPIHPGRLDPPAHGKATLSNRIDDASESALQAVHLERAIVGGVAGTQSDASTGVGEVL